MGDSTVLGRQRVASPPGASLRVKFTKDRPANLDAAVKNRQRHGNRSRRPAPHWHDQTGILNAGGSVAEYGAAVNAAVGHGLITLHPSGAYLSFKQEGADLFA
jgi:hypothetical protein